jgi:hypothetical protein
MFEKMILKQAAKRGVKVIKNRKITSLDRWLAKRATGVMTRKLSPARLLKGQ